MLSIIFPSQPIARPIPPHPKAQLMGYGGQKSRGTPPGQPLRLAPIRDCCPIGRSPILLHNTQQIPWHSGLAFAQFHILETNFKNGLVTIFKFS